MAKSKRNGRKDKRQCEMQSEGETPESLDTTKRTIKYHACSELPTNTQHNTQHHLSAYRVHVLRDDVVLEGDEEDGGHVDAHSAQRAQQADEEDQRPAVAGAALGHAAPAPTAAAAAPTATHMRTHVVAHGVSLVLHALRHLVVLALLEARLPLLKAAAAAALRLPARRALRLESELIGEVVSPQRHERASE